MQFLRVKCIYNILLTPYLLSVLFDGSTFIMRALTILILDFLFTIVCLLLLNCLYFILFEFIFLYIYI